MRSHYDGISITLPDAPRPDEIAIICAYATRGRPNHRVGGLAADEIKGTTGSPDVDRESEESSAERSRT